MSDINRLIALNPYQAPSVVNNYVAGQRVGTETRRANEQAMLQRQQAEQARARNQERSRMLQMGAGPEQLFRAGFGEAGKGLSGLQKDKRSAATDAEKLGLEKRRIELQEKQYLAGQQPGAPDKPKVQKAELHAGGGATIVLTDGTMKTLRPEEVDAQFIKDAEMRGAELQGLRAGERASATAAQKTSTESFEKAFKIRQNIGTFQQVIEEVKAGAGTGPLKARLPSLRAASVRLDNLQKRLGLDLIQATTFGALSESELKFALDTVLPNQLDGPELVKWTEDKIAAQTKLAEELEDLAIYTGTKGAKLSTWLLEQKQERKKASKKAQSQPTQSGQQQADNDPLGIR